MRNFWEYDIEFSGELASEHGIYIVRRPNIPTAEREYEEVDIPGRDGVLYIDKKTVKDIEIHVEMNFMDKPDRWFERTREARRWLFKAGKAMLRFADDAEYYYRVKKVIIEENERVCREIGRFTTVFVCEGYMYRVDGNMEKEIKDVLYNPSWISKPTYQIEGEGACTLTVNGKEFEVNVGQNVTIDTDRMITYRKDGELKNSDAKGDYEDLFLMPGENEIYITKGFDMKIIPNWRDY